MRVIQSPGQSYSINNTTATGNLLLVPTATIPRGAIINSVSYRWFFGAINSDIQVRIVGSKTIAPLYDSTGAAGPINVPLGIQYEQQYLIGPGFDINIVVNITGTARLSVSVCFEVL